MEAYKQYLLSNIDFGYPPEIRNTNENGLHSYFTGSYYEPALVLILNHTHIYWFFDGEIRDCEHPFHIILLENTLCRIVYYSSERIRSSKPVVVNFNQFDSQILYNCYRLCRPGFQGHEYCIILEGINKNICANAINIPDHLFTSEFYPLYDRMAEDIALKFAD